ncbi:MAG: ADP-forming succinate--CoA ligase subunit beta [Phycisphaeraceae bacterium]|nr:ADP-forming succinate--CoA ligase subunit beta [Phycisphaeraceae bacterium]
MRIHEHQARALLRGAGVATPRFSVAHSVPDAVTEAQRLFGEGAKEVVMKAQVHAGGRGKAGFVKLVRSGEEARKAAEFMLSTRMKSPQTPPEGLEVRTLLVAEAVEIAKEFYLAVTLDRSVRTNLVIASAEGGTEIETVAEERPEAILRVPMDPVTGLAPYQAREIAFKLGFHGRQVAQAVTIMLRLAKLAVDRDASLAEVNPLVVTPPSSEHPDGQVLAIDAKFTFDDNALFRQSEVADLFDPTEENPAEIRAHEFGLSYVALDGSIGCLVNGAGLAMSTMDLVKLHGGHPANFLDVGGSASEEAVGEAFRIILADPRVKGVLVNIFGGIMPCDRIARAIVAAATQIGFKVPLVVRLEGTNVDAARRILKDAQRSIPTMQAASDLTDAARRIVAATGAKAAALA